MTFDRRSDDRIYSESVKINLHLAVDTTSPCRLIDLSFSNISILSEYKVEEGSDVELDIISKNESITKIAGYVVRCNILGVENKIAIKFYPFSTIGKYNSMENYHKLKNLLRQLGEQISLINDI